MRYGKFLTLGATLIAIAAITSNALAWACTGSPVITLSPASGPAGTHVRIDGGRFETTRPFEIRWDGVDGPSLGTASVETSVSFSTAIVAPDATPGVHAVLAVQRDEVGRVIHKAAQMFEVTSPGSLPVGFSGSGDLWRGYSGAAANASASSLADAVEAGTQKPTSFLMLGATLVGFGGALGAVGLGMTLRRRRLPAGS